MRTLVLVVAKPQGGPAYITLLCRQDPCFRLGPEEAGWMFPPWPLIKINDFFPGPPQVTPTKPYLPIQGNLKICVSKSKQAWDLADAGKKSHPNNHRNEELEKP